jgi:hypothetical protein
MKLNLTQFYTYKWRIYIWILKTLSDYQTPYGWLEVRPFVYLLYVWRFFQALDFDWANTMWPKDGEPSSDLAVFPFVTHIRLPNHLQGSVFWQCRPMLFYGLMVRGSNPGGGEIFRTRPDRPSKTMVTGSFPGVQRPGHGVEHSPPSSAEVKERLELYLYSPSGPSLPCSRVKFTFNFRPMLLFSTEGGRWVSPRGFHILNFIFVY